MSSWQEKARRKLANSLLSDVEREEISRELAGYLEDLCTDATAAGLDASAAAQIDATRMASAELHEDKHLGATLYRARKENAVHINERTKRFWLPGTTILLASAVLLNILQFAGFSPYFPRFWNAGFGSDVWTRYSFFIYVPWLCILPFLGGAAAYWSRRSGSTRAVSVAAGLFPSVVLLALFVAFVPLAFAVDTLPPAKIFVPALAGQILSWVVIPGAALFLGVLPFLRRGELTQDA